MPSRTPQRRPETEQLREHIRNMAVQQFARQGYRGTSVQELADAVGISKQLLLYHYASKEAVMEAVMEAVTEAWSSLLPLLLDVLTAEDEPFEERLKTLCDALEEKQDAARVVLMELVNEPFNQSSVTSQLDVQAGSWLGMAADSLRQRQTEGAIPANTDPEAWVVQASTMILSTIALLHLGSGRWPVNVPHPQWRQRRLRETLRILKASLRA